MYAFAPILSAQGALLAGLVGNRVLYQGATLLSFKVELVALIGVFMVVVLGPLTVFARQLLHANTGPSASTGTSPTSTSAASRSAGCAGTGGIPSCWGRATSSRWPILAGSYDIIREMRIVPFGLHDVSLFAAAMAVPLAPLVLTIVSLDELVSRLSRSSSDGPADGVAACRASRRRRPCCRDDRGSRGCA